MDISRAWLTRGQLRLIKVNEKPVQLIISYFCNGYHAITRGSIVKFYSVLASLHEITTFNLKKLSNLAWIRLMMIAAQLLLTGFAAHWLNMQYHERQVLLTRDVDLAWNDARNKMIDSMLLKEYIQPALDSTVRYDFKFEFNTDSILSKSMITESVKSKPGQKPVVLPAGKSKIIVRIDDSSKSINPGNHGQSAVMSRDLVLQGVKLFVNSSQDSSGRQIEQIESWTQKPDTALLKLEFFNRLTAIDPSIRPVWTTDSITDKSGSRHTIRYSMVVGEKNLEAGVEGYSMVIIHQILPQMGFALLLILLTATAFIISFRSLKSQIALNNQRNDFIRNMSHELKTPVATVKVALEALKNFDRRNDPVLMDEYLEMATAETNRLEMLISRVMNISASNGEMIKSNPEQTDMGELIRDVLQAFKPRIEAEKAIVALNLPDKCIKANIDRLHLQGVILNLIDNSLKYSIPPAEIEIGLSSEKNGIRISVSDRGIGIPPEYRTRIFEKFFRVPTGDRHNVKGYGLGLSYAEMVMKQHGGSIGFCEREGGGSIFELTLPQSTL
jgi:signal transduction histidine kinase